MAVETPVLDPMANVMTEESGPNIPTVHTAQIAPTVASVKPTLK